MNRTNSTGSPRPHVGWGRAGARLVVAGLIAGATVALVFGAPGAAAEEGDGAILGRWRPGDRPVVVEVVRAGSGFAGRVVESENRPELVGKELLRHLAWDAAKRQYKGEVLAVRRATWVSATIAMKGDSAFALTASAGPVSRTIEWRRP